MRLKKKRSRGGRDMTPQTTTDRTNVRAEILVQAPIDRAFAVFAEHCDEWWPRPYRLGRAERLNLQLEPYVGGRWYERTAEGDECDWGKVLVGTRPAMSPCPGRSRPASVPNPTRGGRVGSTSLRFPGSGSNRRDPRALRIRAARSRLEVHARWCFWGSWLAGPPAGLCRVGERTSRERRGITRPLRKLGSPRQ